MGTKGTYLSTAKAMYDKHTANIIVNDGKLKGSLKAETRQACSLSPLLFNTALEFRATVIRKGKNNNDRLSNLAPVSLQSFQSVQLHMTFLVALTAIRF